MLSEQFCRMGEDPKREGLLETPKRVKAFKEYFQGYNEDATKVLDKTLVT